jgi:iron complex outermembrane receptor protein
MDISPMQFRNALSAMLTCLFATTLVGHAVKTSAQIPATPPAAPDTAPPAADAGSPKPTTAPVPPQAPANLVPAKPAEVGKSGTVRPTAPKTETLEITERRTATSEHRDSSASKIIITRDDIEQYGDSNLGDVMRRLPGVTVGGRPGRGGPPAMRGMAGGFTQILINGERVSPGFSIEQITPEMVERIEILRAPTAETGTRAVAGTINVVLREPLRQRNNDIRVQVQEERSKFSPNLSLSRNDTMGPTGT